MSLFGFNLVVVGVNGGFLTVVHAEPELLLERGAAAQAVHGISNEEICSGPEFPVAWGRFLAWVEGLMHLGGRDKRL